MMPVYEKLVFDFFASTIKNFRKDKGKTLKIAIQLPHKYVFKYMNALAFERKIKCYRDIAFVMFPYCARAKESTQLT
jgi:hypothetical protein